jgi:ribosome-associated toxin RatA of RatAB toxin-antitoxin module
MLWHEPLDDKSTRKVWSDYITKYEKDIEPSEIDAAEVCSVEEFSKHFEIWVTSKSSKRIKVLMVWHGHFLSLACQQTLRRWLETKSYRCRVWFHVEMLNNVQSAIMSRCILKFVNGITHTINEVKVIGEGEDTRNFWKTITNENELKQKALKH